MQSNTNWLAKFFQYIYDVVVSADRPITMASMVILPFIAPLLPALITSSNLQMYLFPDHPSWVWIGVVAFELVAMLSQVAVVSANMRLVDEPNNKALISESKRATWSYVIYILTLIASNVVLELANNVNPVNVVVVACLTVGLSFSASLVNATRIHKRDKDIKEQEDKKAMQDREDLLRKEQIEHEDKVRQETNEFKIKSKLVKAGMNPLQHVQQFQSTTTEISPVVPKGDWRLLSESQRNQCRHTLSIQQIMNTHNVSKSTAYEWKKS
jgi:hypothetical protein